MPKAYKDTEETSLYGERARKDSPRIRAIGDIDELNSFVGVAASAAEDREIKEILRRIQNDLLVAGADLATPMEIKEKRERISEGEIRFLEETISGMEKEFPPLAKFILPGGSAEASLMHACRSICRRAERSVVSLKRDEEINVFVFVYINRLSDLFFALARLANKRKGVKDEEWAYSKPRK